MRGGDSQQTTVFSYVPVEIRSPAVRPESILQVAMVFPQVKQRSSNGTAGVRGLPRNGAGAVLPKSPLWSPERYDRADSKAGAAAKGVPNVAVVRNRCIAAMLYLCQEGHKGNPG